MKLSKLLISAVASVGVVLAATGTARGNYVASPVPFSFTDISGTGTVVGALTGVDDVSTSVTMPFTFNFYGAGHNSVFVSSNGLLTFGAANSTFTNTDLTTVPAQAAIAPFWDDLWIRNTTPPPVPGTARVYTQTLGPVGSRQFVVQWDEVTFFFGGSLDDTLTFQAILFEGSGDILFNYLDLVSGTALGNQGASATVGIKNAGTQGPDRLLLAFNNGPNAFVGSQQSTLIRVPEPATLTLLGLALAAFGFARRRELH